MGSVVLTSEPDLLGCVGVSIFGVIILEDLDAIVLLLLGCA